MSLQNKVDPFGGIQAVAMRGLYMGNRGGRMHDPVTRRLIDGKQHVSRQWITCLTDYKGRKRSVMGPGYTELFFLDEVAALAAGHRPCAECRRTAFKQYCAAAMPGARIKAAELDMRLHGERMAPRRPLADLAGDLPDGAMLGLHGIAYARRGKFAFPFSFDGYGAPVPYSSVALQPALLLTPATSIDALRNGYAPHWHPSAGA